MMVQSNSSFDLDLHCLLRSVLKMTRQNLWDLALPWQGIFNEYPQCLCLFGNKKCIYLGYSYRSIAPDKVLFHLKSIDIYFSIKTYIMGIH